MGRPYFANLRPDTAIFNIYTFMKCEQVDFLGAKDRGQLMNLKLSHLPLWLVGNVGQQDEKTAIYEHINMV